MGQWFGESIVDTGRLPQFFLLVAFVLTFLFIRFSVRMIRAEVSWWPGNVTPGGVHVHHVFFGVIMMLISGFGFVVAAPWDSLLVDSLLAILFGIGAALVLDEFALVLHLRDVYWEEEGRTSIDAVFVAVAIGLLFLLGMTPLWTSETTANVSAGEGDVVVRVGAGITVAINVVLATITLLKGKVWTGLVGLFLPVLLLFGAIRIARPRSPWSRWRYGTRPRKYEKAVARETRYREPLIRWKVAFQEAVAGRFGLPEDLPEKSQTARVPDLPPPDRGERAPNPVLSALKWRSTRRRLDSVPVWRLPVTLVSLAIVAALVSTAVDDAVRIESIDVGTTATLLAVIAGAMATLTGLVFTAVTLAMQFGGSQISVRVIPMLQQQPMMRWSIGVFLATFAYTLIIAAEITASRESGHAPGISATIAAILTLASAYLFIALVGKVGNILNSSQLLRWLAAEGRGAIYRRYPVDAPPPAASILTPPPEVERDGTEPSMVITLREVPSQGRVLLAVNLPRLQRLAIRWGVRIDLLVGVGDHVTHNAPVFEILGSPQQVRRRQLLSCLLFGDTHSPAASPAAALQAISDIALKALSPGINDPSRGVQALDHIEDLLLMLAPRVLAEQSSPELSKISGYGRSWDDFLAIGTDQVRQYSRGSAQVQRRLRALLETLAEQCPDEQQAPICSRLDALDRQAERDWPDPLDQWLASAADRQGYGSEAGSHRRRLSIRSQRPARPVT
ncbi:DUF2254 domain-containing protein [Gordonia rhizosphera]|uniref:DUF2254 domain-containing protein n=1 Tax=Gordonia rhizosphera NBRC 16068 TaxID=1108045 RepID=K6WWI4_9ACTN|nr:DUF2254 family protein [Gordonia rhizosphera]GAB90914.1 hypothetical protein GORHZ_119_00420 [Gordonia rhizosphera NBRC 16068]